MTAPPGNSRHLTKVHQEALAQERYEWQVLEHLRIAGTPQERQRQLGLWIEANRVLREAQASLTRNLAQEARERFRCWLDAPAHGALPPPGPSGGSTATVSLAMLAPSSGQRLRARDGSVWWVEAVAIDELDPGHFLAQVRRGPQADGMEDGMEIYAEDWPLVSRIYGLSEIPAAPASLA